MNIRELAKKAKVATATVSRVINGTVPVSEKVTTRVRQAIEELNFFPNTHARALGSGRSRIYGLIISDITNPFFPELVKSFETIAVKHGQEVIVANTDYQPKRMELCVRRMLERKVDGVAIMTSEMEPGLIDMLRKSSIPLVCLDTAVVGKRISNIEVDYTGGVEQALDHLLQLGHRRISFISGPMNLQSSRTRHHAFCQYLQRKNIECKSSMIAEGNHRVDGGRSAMSRLLKLKLPPTAVLTSNDLSAIGAMGAIHEAGLTVPKDISLIGFDDIELSSFIQPPLTTLRASRTEIATRAFMSLFNASEKGEIDGTACRIEATLVVRESTAKVHGSKGSK